MHESYPNNSDEPRDEGLTPGGMEEAFVADGARRAVEGMWNPDDPEWKETYEAHRLLHDAGLAQPSVDLDKLREVIAEKRDEENSLIEEIEEIYRSIEGDEN